MTCLWPPPKTAALRLSDRTLITDHQAWWTINLNQGHHRKPPLHIFLALLAQKFLSMFSMSRHVQRTGWRDSTVYTVCHLCLGLKERETGERQTEPVSTHWEKKICKSCPSEKCEVNEIRHAEQSPSIHYVKIFDWGGLKAHYLQTTTPNPLLTLQETVSLCPDRPPR